MHRHRFPVVMTTLMFGIACQGGDKTIGTSNRAPDAAFMLPIDGSEFDEGTVVEFYGTVGDDGPLEDLRVSWVSSIDGVLPDFDPPDANGEVDSDVGSEPENAEPPLLSKTL